MSDPVNPDGANRRNVDENVARKRSTDPRLRAGVVGMAGVTDPMSAPAPPPAMTPSAPPSLLGLPGQAMPEAPDFDAPTVAQLLPDLPVQPVRPAPPPPLAVASSPAAPPPPASLRMDTAFVDFEGGPATSVDVAPAMPARPRAPTMPGAILDDVDTGSPRRPVRERVRSATGPIAIPPPAVLDPPVDVRRSTNVAALDPPVEASGSRVRPVTAVAALDPPVEASSSRVRPVAALDPPVEASGSRVRPASNGVDVVDVSPRDAPRSGGWRGLLPIGVAVAAAVAVVVVVGGGGAGASHRYSAAEERQLADLWLAHGTAPWGGVRTDGVVRAVEQVGAAVAKPLAGRLPAHPLRFVVLNDEVVVQTFALPDGTIAVTTAALRRLGNEAQLAALLGHSLAHVALGDVAAVLDRQTDVEPAVRQALAGGAPHAAVALVTTAATVQQTPVRELEADRVTVSALHDAGYVPTALADVIRNFGVRGGGRRAAWLGLHPDDPARMGGVDEASGGGRTNETEYANRVLDIIGRHAPSTVPTETPGATGPRRGLRTQPTTTTTTPTTPTP